MAKLTDTTFENQLIELESVDSTNNYAMGLIHEGMAISGLVVITKFQTAGKGQRGKSWSGEAGQNLMMSLIIQPSGLNLSQQFLFSAAVALAILDVLQNFERQNWRIKWPNDIYWNDRKAAGILIENHLKAQNWLWAVIGIGINLNQTSFPDEIRHAISLKQITGSDYDAKQLALAIRNQVGERLNLLNAEPEAVLTDYNNCLYKNHEPVTLKKTGELIITDVEGVDARGRLLTSIGSFAHGEVVFNI